MAKITEKIVNIKEQGLEIEKEIREKTVGYILTSLGLVAGLAWNDAVKALIEKYSAGPNSGLQAKFFYAILMTAFVVVISLYLSRIFKVKKKKEKSEQTSEIVPENKKKLKGKSNNKQ